METGFRYPTVEEIFPTTAKQQLSAVQSTDFINSWIKTGNAKEASKNIPSYLPQMASSGIFIEPDNKNSFIAEYFKNNWRVIMLSFSLGAGVGIISYILIRKQLKKTNINSA